MLDSEEQVQQRLPIPLQRQSSGALEIQKRRATMMPQQLPLVRVTPRTATLRSPSVRLSPWKTIFMRSSRSLKHIGISLKRIALL